LLKLIASQFDLSEDARTNGSSNFTQTTKKKKKKKTKHKGGKPLAMHTEIRLHCIFCFRLSHRVPLLFSFIFSHSFDGKSLARVSVVSVLT
jgi:hypothetical protein